MTPKEEKEWSDRERRERPVSVPREILEDALDNTRELFSLTDWRAGTTKANVRYMDGLLKSIEQLQTILQEEEK